MSRVVTTNRVIAGDALTFPQRGIGTSLSARRATADQAIASGSDVVIQFNDVVYDDRGEWNAAGHKWVCSESGMYVFTAASSIGPLTGAEFAQLSLVLGGSVARRGSYATAGGTSRNCNVVLAVGPVRINKDAEAQVAVVHNGAGTVNARFGSANTYFNVHRVL